MATIKALNVKSTIEELIKNCKTNITLHTDSSSAKSITSRRGVTRKTKQIELRQLFVQELVANGTLQVTKVGTLSNPSDIFTKFVSLETIPRQVHAVRLRCTNFVHAIHAIRCVPSDLVEVCETKVHETRAMTMLNFDFSDVSRGRTTKVWYQDVWRSLPNCPDGDEDRQWWRDSVRSRFPGRQRKGEHHRSARGAKNRNPTRYTSEDDTSVGGTWTIYTGQAQGLSDSTVTRQSDQERWIWIGRKLEEGEILRATAPDDPRQGATDKHQDDESWKADERVRLRSIRFSLWWQNRDHAFEQLLAPGISRELRNNSCVWCNHDAKTRNVNDLVNLETIDFNDSRQDFQEFPRSISSMIWRSRESGHFLLHYIRYDQLPNWFWNRWRSCRNCEDDVEMWNNH